MATRKAKLPMIRDAGGPRLEHLGGNQPHATQWTLETRALLGTMPDSQLAEIVGCSAESVRRERERLDVPPFRPRVRWTEADDQVVRELPIAEAARQLGRPPGAIRIRRHRLGLTRSDNR